VVKSQLVDIADPFMTHAMKTMVPIAQTRKAGVATLCLRALVANQECDP
jgi:hypothetical protein